MVDLGCPRVIQRDQIVSGSSCPTQVNLSAHALDGLLDAGRNQFTILLTLAARFVHLHFVNVWTGIANALNEIVMYFESPSHLAA